jgi:uncharacterized membrane protein YfcA
MQLIFTIAATAGLVTATWLGILRFELLLFAVLILPVIILGNRLGARVSGTISDSVWRAAVGVVLGGAALAAFIRIV